MFTRDEMIEYMIAQLEAADDTTVEQYFWLFRCEADEF